MREPLGTRQAELPISAEVTEEIDYRLPLMGHIAEISPNGVPHVTFPGNQVVPIAAQVATERPQGAIRNRRVLLLFEQGNPERPIITGFVQPNGVSPSKPGPTDVPEKVVIDAEHLILRGKKDVEIRCGDSIVLMTENGRLLLRGRQVTSRASGTHKIKGGAVRIN